MNADVTRERLLCSALEIFSTQGYEGASTRDVCAAAGIGNASIHYHFGDKAALYRELFVRLLDEFEQRMRGCGMDRLSGREALLAYYQAQLRPLAENPELARQVYLYLREEFQPSGLVDDLLPRGMELQMELLGALLRRELGVSKLDASLQRLMTTLLGASTVYVVKRRSITAAMPGLMEGAHWLNRIAAHLADAGWTLIEAERQKRSAKATTAAATA
ncbi:MAG: TetR/AcrR family transcriptional regulator [Nevskiales bacterium]